MISVITGPTGSGKSKLAFELAADLHIPVFNTDAFQFYKEIPILSAQPALTQQNEVHFLADRSLLSPISSGEFGRMALSFIHRPGIWVGTGLYLGAALYGLDDDRRKGTPFQGAARADFRMVVLDPPREILYPELDRRIDAMMKGGALEEAERVHGLVERKEISDKNPVLKAIGLKHLLQYLSGALSLEDSVRLWKRDTRRLAKRQWTWIRKFCPPSERVRWLETADKALVLEHFRSRPEAERAEG